MKNIFDLQLFADESENNEAETPENSADNSEKKEPEENAKPQAKYTDEDVDKMFNRKFAEWKKQQEKAISEAERLSKMTAEEKANERINELDAKLREYEAREARAAMTKQARAILQDKNINVSDELLANLIAEDAVSTKKSVESFVALFQAAVEKAVKEAYKGETPKKGGTAALTKEQILAVTNRAERQRLISENIHLFNK